MTSGSIAAGSASAGLGSSFGTSASFGVSAITIPEVLVRKSIVSLRCFFASTELYLFSTN